MPIFIADSGDVPDNEMKITISRKGSPPELIEELFHAAIERRQDYNPDLVVPIAYWVNDLSNEFNKRLRSKLEEALGMTIEEFILCTRFLLLNLTEAEITLSAETMKKPLHAPTTGSDIENRLGADGRETIRNLLECIDDIEGLFKSFFMITVKVYDAVTLETTLQKISIRTLLESLKSISAGKISYAFKIGPKSDNTPLEDLAKRVRTYATLLTTSGKNKESLTNLKTAKGIQDLVPDDSEIPSIRTKLTDLERAMSVLQMTQKESWVEAIKSLNDSSLDFDDLRREISGIAKDLETSETPLEYLALKHRLRAVEQFREYVVLTKLSEMVYSIDLILDQQTANLSAGASKAATNDQDLANKKSYQHLVRMVR